MNKDIIVFDIGGTWFRSGIYTKKRLISLTKEPAINFKNTSFKNNQELQKKLVTYINKQVTLLRRIHPKKELYTIGISMGAALNAHTGYILNSGPLWGPTSAPFDLIKILSENIPNTSIHIINDVSAALLREVGEIGNKSFSKVMLITVSTGIACRIFDMDKGIIPVDKIHGIQGEIGHLPIRFTYKRKDITLVCDCGSKNHLNAFSSGRGIEKLIQLEKKSASFSDLVKDLEQDRKFAKKIVDVVTKPIAELLLIIFTINPEIEKVIFTGGVTHSLKKHYLSSILYHLDKIGMYQVTIKDRNFFKKRIFIGRDDDKSGLIGAALNTKL